jgi:hypothetical protein
VYPAYTQRQLAAIPQNAPAGSVLKGTRTSGGQEHVPVVKNQAAFFWHPAASPRWFAILNQRLFEYRLDDNPPRAARACALGCIAELDAFVAVFDAKYTVWAIRPVQIDPR